MSISSETLVADTGLRTVPVTEHDVVVGLMDGRTISVPLAWFPRLSDARPEERSHWEICGGGYGLHWPELDEDISTEGKLQGEPLRMS